MDPDGFPPGGPGNKSVRQPLAEVNPVLPENLHPEDIYGQVEKKGKKKEARIEAVHGDRLYRILPVGAR